MNKISKGWGREVIFADTPMYTGKLLEFAGEGSRMSLHFHRVKDETWYVLQGRFELTILDLRISAKTDRFLEEGDTWRNKPMLPHRLTCLSKRGVIVEVSTPDDPNDNFRVEPGDSQK